MANAADTFAREITELRRRLVAMERSGQLSRSTVPGPDGEPVTLGAGVRAGITAGAQAAEAIAAAASAQAKADGAVESFFGPEEPKGGKLGDLWRKPTGEVLQHDGGTWEAVTDPQVREDLDVALDRLATTEGALDGKISTYFAPLLEAPTAAAIGDLWIVSDAGNLLRRWDGRTWVDARDQGIEDAVAQADDAAETAEAAQVTADEALQSARVAGANASTATTAAQEAADVAASALADAANAAGIAEGKGDVLIQAAAPATEYRKATTLWIDTTSNTNTPKRWSGSAWVAVTDKRAADAATSATNAANAAKAAQAQAETATQAAADAATAAKAAKDRADDAHALAGTAESNAQAALTSAAGAASAAQEAQGTADTAKADAASAAGLADGKADVLIQATAPATAMRKATTLWIDTTSNANTPKRWNGTAWAAVTDKKATDAATAASNAQKAATAAQEAADSVSKNLFSTAAPSGTAPYGSTWFRVNSSGQVIGQWQQTATGNGATWTVREIRSEVIANLDVGKVTAGTLAVNEAVAKKLFAEVVRAQMVEAEEFIGENAILKGAVTADKLEAEMVLASRIVAGDPEGTHAEMSPAGFRVFAADGDGGAAKEVVRMGVAETDDYFAVTQADGTLAATISQDGKVSGSQVWANDELYYRGEAFADILNSLPRGPLYKAELSGGRISNIDGAYGLIEASWIHQDDRLIQLEFGLKTYPNGGAETEVYMDVRYTRDGSAPTINSTRLFANTIALGRITNLSYDFKQFTHTIRPSTFGTINDGDNIRMLFIVNKGIGNPFHVEPGLQTYFYVTDIGPGLQHTANHNNGGGKLSSGSSTQSAPKTTYVKKYNATGVQNYQGNNSVYPMNNGKMYQGLSPAGYGNLKSIATFPNMTGDLSGATISRIRVYFNFEHWYNNSGGTARIGVHPHTGLPGTFSHHGISVESGGWPKPGSRWVDIPSKNWDAFKTGVTRGVSLEGNGTYGTYGYAGPPTLEITYSK